VPLQQGLRHLQSAFNNFFSGWAKYPRFKQKRSGGSAEFTKSSFRIIDGQLFLAKSKEPLNVVWSQQLPKNIEPSTMTVKLSASGKWSISIMVDIKIEKLPVVTNKIGIDLGISSLAILSSGEKISNPKLFKTNRKKLRKAQKSIRRKKINSKNKEKARLKVAKIHEKIANSRKDFIHKLTTRLVRENQVIAVEDLCIGKMMKNRHLAKDIMDASWGEVLSQLEYKSDWYGRTFVKISKGFPSSKRCSECGHTLSKLTLDVREWDCPKCSTHHDRDINAAKNILAAGLAVNVCGATVRPEQSKSVKAGAMKQKPKS
jgi:putative transposase